MALPEHQFKWLTVLLLAGLAALAYANTFDGEWVWDDASSVLLHETVRDPGRFLELFAEDQHAYGRGQGNFYRPLVAASFMADYALSHDPVADANPALPYPDVKPFLFHLSNIAWHALASVLLFLLLRRLGAPRMVALGTGILYVLHPLHTEAVAYISGRADMMSAVFLYLGLLLALWAAPFPRRLLAWAGVILAFTLGLLSKESSFIFPVLLSLVLLSGVDIRDGKRRDEPLIRWMPLILSLLVFAGYVFLRLTVLRFAEPEAAEAAPFGQRLVEVGQALFFYLQKLFAPTALHMEQSLAGVPAWTSALGWLALITMVAGAIGAWRSGQRRIALGLAWFIAAWLPISGVFPLNAPMAEHWMYVPMAGFWWAVLESARIVAEKRTGARPVFAGAVALLALLFLGLTVARNQDWHSNESLFRATLRENPDTLRVNYNLAVAYEDLEGNLPGARRHYEKVLELHARSKQGANYLLEDEIEVLLSLGNLLLSQEKYLESLRYFGPVASLTNTQQFGEAVAAASVGMGRGLLGLGDLPRASQHFDKAIQLVPEYRAQVERLITGANIS